MSDFHYPYPLLIIAGKGGVGKTVLTAAIGTASAQAGLSTLIVELDGQRQLLPLITDVSEEVDNDPKQGPITISPSLSWESLNPDRLLAAWLSGHSMGLVADRLERSGALSVIATSVPGIRDVLLLGYLRAMLETGTWDRIVVDGPASGRARELLRAPHQVAEAATEGPIHDQGTRAHDLLTDHERTAAVLVTLAEETPVNETIETAFDIEDDPGIRLGGVIVNRIFPRKEPPASFDSHPLGAGIRARYESNIANIGRLEEELPVPRYETTEQPGGIRNPADIAVLLDPPIDTSPPRTVKAIERDGGQIDALLERPVVVTVGTGGVGKTTISAALATRAAQIGKSVALITIDPAKRLVDALGLETLDDDLTPVPLGHGATLAATMLDPGRTFERVVRRHASDDAHAERILQSPLSSQLAESLSGMTEYMAVERLWELHNDASIDLVVVDTPPSSDALAFLDAPTLLARLLDNRMYQVLVHGNKRSIVDRAIGGLVSQLVSVVGGAVVRDAVEFFQSFAGIEDGFRERGGHIHDLLRSDDAGIALVASPTGSSLDNAEAFLGQLREADVTPQLTIINRCTPEVPSAGRAKGNIAIVDHLRRKRAAEHDNIEAYISASTIPVELVDDLPVPVTDLDSVVALAEQLSS